jgi:predicted nucleic acid-binding protein
MTTSNQTPTIVLDTNVVLDWLVFADPAVEFVAKAITSGSLRWIASQGMREELERVLTRPALSAHCTNPGVVLAAWTRCTTVPTGSSSSTLHGLRCSDPDDQIFVDLATASRSRWLFTRDRALLALARPARAHGLDIRAPLGWQTGSL